MAESAQQGGKLNVFISYSRDDLAFADQLDASLQLGGFETTIDRRGISSGEDWRARLGALIRDADTVVFVLSPSSAQSPICVWEVEEAFRLGKRILPVICCPLGGAKSPRQLADLDYIFFYAEPKFPGSGFGSGLLRLASALNTDLDWLREHTRYLRLAKEWEEVGKPPDRRLLSAADIALARAWVGSRPPKAPEITPLQVDFIQASEAEDERQRSAEAQRQKHEAEAQKREAEQAKRVARRTMMGLAAAVVLALAASGFAFVAYQQRQTALRATATANTERNKADEQRKLAEQATKAAKIDRDNALRATQQAETATKETQRQLERANQALAESINNDLGVEPDKPLTPRQRQALWKLAIADEPIKRDFVSILASSPEETIRVSPGLARVSRALGLLRATEALDVVLKQIDQTTDPNALQVLAQALQALPVKPSEAEAGQALYVVLKQIGQTTDPVALRALAQALQALPVKPSEAEAGQALDVVLKQIGQNPPLLGFLAQTLEALAAKLSEAQAGRALDVVLKQIGQTTDPFALRDLPKALQALAAKLSEAQAGRALDVVLKQIGQTTDPFALGAQAQALQALAAKLSEAQAGRALDVVLKQIGQTTDPDALRALAQALQALAAKPTEAQVVQAASVASASLAWAADDEEATEWARALVALTPTSDRDRTLVAAVAYPAAGGSATEILLDAIRARHPDAPAKEAGTKVALAWLAKTFPDARGPPVCPKPLQPRLECPPFN
jgi:hypothetical protein